MSIYVPTKDFNHNMPLFILTGCGSAGFRSGAEAEEPKLAIKVEDPINPIFRDSSQWVIEGKVRVSVASMEQALNELRTQLKDRGDVTRQDVRGQKSFPRANLTAYQAQGITQSTRLATASWSGGI